MIISGNLLIDAISGNQFSAVSPSLIFYNSTQSSTLEYSTKSLFFTRVITPMVSPSGIHSLTSTLNAYDVSTGVLKWSVNGGNNAFNRDTAKTVDQIFNNQAIIRSRIEGSAGIYGPYYSYAFFGYDLNTGQFKWQYDAGFAGQYFNAGNVQFSNGVIDVNTQLTFPQTPTIVAGDIYSGKLKWSNTNKIPINYHTRPSICLYTGGKGFSSYIQ